MEYSKCLCNSQITKQVCFGNDWESMDETADFTNAHQRLEKIYNCFLRENQWDANLTKTLVWNLSVPWQINYTTDLNHRVTV